MRAIYKKRTYGAKRKLRLVSRKPARKESEIVRLSQKHEATVKVALPKIPNLRKLIKTLPNYNPFDMSDGYYFDEKVAKKAIDFFHTTLVHVKGSKAGQPFVLELWEIALIANIFGWRSEETGFRRYREVFLEVGRKNGKTPIAAGIILYLLTVDGEPGAEIYGAASEFKQASLVWEHARGMVDNNQWLFDNCAVYKGQIKAIELLSDHSIYRVISSDAFSKHGYNASGIVIDELHTQNNRELVDVLVTSTAGRTQPLIVYITTRDYDRESICNETEAYALGVCNGTVNDAQFLPAIYIPNDDDDWTDREVWKKANPNLGVSVNVEFLEREFEKAKKNPAYENFFKRVHLNFKTAGECVWLNMESWDAITEIRPISTITDEPCYIGLDMSAVRDMTALAALFKDGSKIYAYLWYWLPDANLEHRIKTDKYPYEAWSKKGFLTLTPGEVVDHGAIRDKIAELVRDYNVKEVAYDPWNFEPSRQILINEFGINEDLFVEFRQGFPSMTAPSKAMETMVVQKTFIHNQNPILRTNAQACVVETDVAGNYRPSKNKSTQKIDGIVACITGLGRAILTEVVTPNYSDIYAKRGIICVSDDAKVA